MIHVFEITTQGAASGTWSLNTLPLNGIVRQIVLLSADTTVTFEFQVIDEKSNIIYDTKIRETTPTGVLNDEVALPVRGICTLKVYEASSDASFTGRLLMDELK